MNKSKSSLIFNICQTEGNTSLKSSTNDLYNSTLPNIRTNLLNGFFYECPIEKYNEKINLWQKAYLCVKRNYLYLYDKKPKLLDKPKEFLFLNNKITFIFHKKLFKMKAVKCFVVNFKINNEALSKSLIEDNKHNLFISFKSKKNYDNFEKVLDNVIKAKQYTNSVSPNLLGITKKEKNEKIEKKEKESKNPRKNNVSTDKKMCKNLTSIHLKNKSMNEIAIKKSLIFSEHSKKSKEKNLNKSIKVKNEKETKQHDNILCTNNSKSMNSENKSNNCIQNVFTFSKVENLSNNTNDKKLKNSNSTNKSKQQNSNSQRINNNNTDKVEFLNKAIKYFKRVISISKLLEINIYSDSMKSLYEFYSSYMEVEKKKENTNIEENFSRTKKIPNELLINSYFNLLMCLSIKKNWLEMNLIIKDYYNRDLISNKIGKKSLHQELQYLYNEDSCEYLFQDNHTILDFCNNFWSSILKQGIEQSTIQFRVNLDNLLLNLVQINENEVYEPDYSILYYIEIYITSYFLWSFESTIEIFDNIRNNQTDTLIWNFNGLCIFYLFMIFFLLIPLNIAIHYAKENFNSFLNFIGIIPVQYLSEDEKFYRETLNLEGNIFY